MGDGLLQNGRGRVLLFCWLGWVFDFYDLILFSFTKRSIAADLGLELWPDLSWIEGWSLFATAIGGFLFGRIADLVGRRSAMIWSIVVFSIGAVMTGMAEGYWSLLVARVITGLGVGGEWGIGHAVVADYWSGKQRDKVHGILQAGSPVAMAMAAAVGCFVAPLPDVGWRAVFYGSGALAVLALAGRWAMPGPDRAVSQRAVAQRTVAQRTVAETTSGVTPMRARELLAPAYRRTTLVLLTILTLHMAGFWCVYAELPAALMQMHRVAIGDVGWFQIQVNSVHIVADVMFGFLAARLGRLRVFVGFCLVFAGGQALVLGQLQSLQDDFGSFTLAIAAMGLGAGTWSCFGALFGEHYPAALRATAAALCYALARAIQLPLKGEMGEVFQATGSFAPALWVGIACALLSALMVIWLPRSRSQPPE